MRTPVQAATLRPVDQPRIQRVTLEIEQGSDPLRGRLLAGESIRQFKGWLGLAVALEQATEHGRGEQLVPAPDIADQ